MTTTTTIIRHAREGRDLTRSETLDLCDALEAAQAAAAAATLTTAGVLAEVSACAVECDRWRMACLVLIEGSSK